MEIKAILVNETSKKGNKYLAVDIYITPEYKKRIFLDDAEIALIKALYGEI